MSLRSALQETRLVVPAVALALLACAGLDSPRAARPRAVAPAGWERYLVQPGDTVSRIAACRGVSVERLARANGLLDPDRVVAGQRLRVPAADLCERGRAKAEQDRQAGDAELAALAPKAAEPLPAAEASERAARARLDAAQAQYDAARFEEALAGAETAAGELARYAGRRESDALRARCLLLAGMAATALDERDRALALFSAAFGVDPELSLPREDTSPRILELVDEVPRGKIVER